jgi:hypothetical protein
MLRVSNFFLFLAPVITFFYLILRIFFGLDFTDEMQYYGEIQGLISSNSLFTNDYFIQQTGYILIHPFLKIIFSFEPQFAKLVFYNRVLLFFLIILFSSSLIFLASTYKLSYRIFSSCILAISITDFLPFALSYNTIGYLLITLILSYWLFYNKEKKLFIIAVLILFLGWAYPPQGFLFSIIIFINYYLVKPEISLRFIIYLFILSLIFLIFLSLLNYFNIDTFINALRFTSIFGLSFKLFIYTSIAVFLFLIFGILYISVFYYEPNFFIFLKKNYNLYFYLLSFIFLIIGFILILLGIFFLYSIIFWFAAISLMTAATTIKDKKKKYILIKILISAILISAFYSLSSGNGFFAVYKGFFILFGFLYLVTSSVIEEEKDKKKELYFSLFGIIIFFGILINILSHPYRDNNIFNTWHKIPGIYAYENIYISKTKFLAIQEIRKNISISENKKLLVLGPHPWIYFALNARPETPHFFNHFSGLNEEKAQKLNKFIQNKINLISPDYIIDAMPETFPYKENLSYTLEGYSCKVFIINKELNILLEKETNFPLPLKMKFCEKNYS